MKILNRSQKVSKVEYFLIFDLIDQPDSYYRYLCDIEGNVFVDQLSDTAFATYERCLSGDLEVSNPYVEEMRMDYTAAAIGQCDCGELVVLDSYGNVCSKCGIEYDIEGDKLLVQRIA